MIVLLRVEPGRVIRTARELLSRGIEVKSAGTDALSVLVPSSAPALIGELGRYGQVAEMFATLPPAR
ncbi:MAG: hypothetical protein KC503_32890 [Myxococcales bacterium]|nr:hypothetical protein [Myxococcales bacterium]